MSRGVTVEALVGPFIALQGPPFSEGYRRAARARRAAFFNDLIDAAAATLMRLNALGDQLDDLADLLGRYDAGHPERVRARAVLFGLLHGLRCCEVLTPAQADGFAARMRQGIAEGWL